MHMRVNSQIMKLRILTLGLVVNGWITLLYHFNNQQHHLQMNCWHTNRQFFSKK